LTYSSRLFRHSTASKAECGQLNLAHVATNKKYKQKLKQTNASATQSGTSLKKAVKLLERKFNYIKVIVR